MKPKCPTRLKAVDLEAGELFVVPRGVEHCPEAEPRETVNTGDAGGDLTAEPVDL